MEIRVRPGPADWVGPDHFHPLQEERFEVVSGTPIFRIEGAERAGEARRRGHRPGRRLAHLQERRSRGASHDQRVPAGLEVRGDLLCDLLRARRRRQDRASAAGRACFSRCSPCGRSATTSSSPGRRRPCSACSSRRFAALARLRGYRASYPESGRRGQAGAYERWLRGLRAGRSTRILTGFASAGRNDLAGVVGAVGDDLGSEGSLHALDLGQHLALQRVRPVAHLAELAPGALELALELEHRLHPRQVEALLRRSSAGCGAAARRPRTSRGGCSSPIASG